MGIVSIPTSPSIDSSAFDAALASASADRRSLLRGGAALGLAAAAFGSFNHRVGAQDSTTPAAPGETVGSDPHSMSTGSASPVPAGEPVFALYDPRLAPVEAGEKDVELVAKDQILYVAKDVPYAGWTFNGTIPGPAIRVRQGDTVNFTFKVDPAASTAHSVDFHSAKTPPDVNYKTIMPGEEFKWSFPATTAGAFMYHCGTPPVLMHIGAGMYGTMIVDPAEGWPEAQEFVLVQSDFYLAEGEGGIAVPDYTKMLGHGSADFVTFNGYANQYVENPIEIEVGKLVRIFVMNAGPNVWSSFHVVGAIFDKAYVNANPNNLLQGLQSITIGPGDGACVEFTVEKPGNYVAVNHAFGHAAHGAIAIFMAR